MNHAFQYSCTCIDSSFIESELDQWDISKHDLGKVLLIAYALEFTFLEP